MLDETGFYAPSMAHNALPRRPCRCISGYQGIILQTLNSFAIRSQGSTCALAVAAAYVPYVVVLTTIYLLPLKLALLSQLLEEGREHSAAFVTADAYICLHLMIELLHLQ